MVLNMKSTSPEDQKYPRLVIIISGKRKSGKDHLAGKILDRLDAASSDRVVLLRIARPIKSEYARLYQLDIAQLSDSSKYKEAFRLQMVAWSESHRMRFGMNCFLELDIKQQQAFEKPVWLLNDARRLCDIQYFTTNQSNQFASTKIITIRLEADLESRRSRGWTFVRGIDDKETECGLDTFDGWTYLMQHNDQDRASRDQLLYQEAVISSICDQILSVTGDT